jgi:hypothetical protein
MRGFLWGVPLIILLAGCSDPGTAETATGSQDVTVDEEPAPTVFDPMISTMDEAAAVEDLSMDRKAEMDRAIDGS